MQSRKTYNFAVMKKKIMHLISELDIGGTEKQLLLLVPVLQAEFANHVICMIGEGRVGKSLQEQGIPVHYLRGKHRIDVRIPYRLFRILRQQRPAALLTYLIFADIVGRIIGRLARVPTVIASQRSSLFGPARWQQMDRATRWLVTHYTVQTIHAKHLLMRVLGLPSDRLTVIANAVASQRLRRSRTASRSEHATPATGLVLVSVANLKPEKGLDVLLRAFDQLQERFPAAHLWLVGEGPERKKLEGISAHLTSGANIHFLGLREDIPDILAAADIFILPTSIEGMSNALLEAMAAGLPCVASDIPVNREVITPGRTGLVFRLGDEESLLTSLTQLLTQPELRSTISQAAAAHAATHHSTHHIAGQWIRLIHRFT